jgi:hypothetical protein
MPHLWLSVAKNEIRLWSSRFRNHRPLVFLLIGLIVITYAFVLVPLILSFVNEPIYAALTYIDELSGVPGVHLLPFFMYYVFSLAILYIFIWCITYPLSSMLQGAQDLAGQLEIMLATPIKAQDIMFGKFIARLPTYSIFLFAFAPWLVNLLMIKVPLSIAEQLLIYLVLFVTIIMAMWLGTLLASYVESKVRKSERSRDLGRAMTFIITILTVVLNYALIWVFMAGFSDPTSPLYNILQVFPSTWGTVIILNIFGYSAVVPGNVGVFIALLVGITAFLLYFGFKAAGRFYSLEPVEIGTERVTGEGRLYGVVRRLVPGDFGVQVVSQLKQFSRKLENFSRIGYAVGMSAIIVVFQMFTPKEAFIELPLLVTFAIFFPPMMIAGLLGTWVVIGSKDNLWIYKKAPGGVSAYARSVYIVHLIYTLPIALIFTGIMAVVLGLTLVDVLLAVAFSVLFMLSLMAMAIGMAFIFPTFEERGSKVGILIMGFMGIAFGALTGAAFLAFGVLPFLGLFGWSLCCLIIVIPIGVALLKIGIKKLEALE